MLTQTYGTLHAYQTDALENAKCIGICLTKSNSVRLQRSLDPIIRYNRAWQNVCCIAYVKESLVVSTSEGVSRVILDTAQVIHKQVYIAPFKAFKDGFLFTTSNDSQLFYYNFDEVQTFAGGDERSSTDEIALCSQFYTPTDIAVELGNIVYVSVDNIVYLLAPSNLLRH